MAQKNEHCHQVEWPVHIATLIVVGEIEKAHISAHWCQREWSSTYAITVVYEVGGGANVWIMAQIGGMKCIFQL